ncbi:MAG TPA: DUF5615 family PIN-like protein [Verrucomicrobiota bacterium]|nr:DUF5615 family PIN-like protein [Verrucomicrobiota bacterium]
MKFLVDAHLPGALCRLLRDAGHDVVHTRDLADGNRTPDSEILRLAHSGSRTVITKDADFYHTFLLRGVPPKLLLVTVGNLRKRDLVRLFQERMPSVLAALEEHDFVEFGPEA